MASGHRQITSKYIITYVVSMHVKGGAAYKCDLNEMLGAENLID